MQRLFLFLLFVLYTCTFLQAQDTLPHFSLKNAGKNRIVISWTNPFADIRQLSIQRSADSLKGFKTILTMADPTTPQNGFVDTKAPDDKQFYRLYIMQEGGRYQFSKAKKVPVDSSVIIASLLSSNPLVSPLSTPAAASIRLVDSLLRIDSVTRARPVRIEIGQFQTGDSASLPNAVMVKNMPTAFIPSLYVYTTRDDGHVQVTLPADTDKKYMLKFFEDDGSPLFEIREVKEKTFKIDKASFFHAGWFRFELYENGKLLEKHRFFLSSEF
ncbi:MAG: hypothetical protein IAE96_11580 [Chitinophagaceae bacterium]|nr:hypothetical protein [Chitinophagaceae bacterium]